MSKKFKSLDTRVVHAGEPDPRIQGAVVLPVFQSSTYVDPGGADYHDIKYVRLNNSPNHEVLHAKLAVLENAEAALVTSSGMAAITSALLTTLKAGDHLLSQDTLYGGTHSFVVSDLPKLGVEHDFVDPTDPGSWEAKLRPNTKVFYAETISNPLMGVGHLTAIVEFAKAHNLTTLIDNTFASPVNFRPAEHGFDVALHSCTKYMNGHNDLAAGAVIGRKDIVDEVKHKVDHLGGTLDPHACFLLHRGLKTLALRVERQNQSALAIAKFLESHSKVKSVNYPGLESHPQHAVAAKLFDGFGGMLSFEIDGNLKDVDRFMRAVEIPIIAPSLGGVESLITRPAATSHAGLTPDERARRGISDTLVRLSVGIEGTNDLIDDLDAALRA